MRMKPMMSRAKDLFSSSRVRALQCREKTNWCSISVTLTRIKIRHKKL